MENRKGFISFGKCNKNYCFLILGALLIKVLIIVIPYYLKKNKEVDENDVNILSYLFFKNLGESLMIIPVLILRKNVSLKKQEPIAEESTKISIEYIFNRESIDFSLKEKIIFCASAMLKLIVDLFDIIIKFHIEKNTNPLSYANQTFYFLFIFLFFLSKKLYNLRFYRHQYISITFITLSSLIIFISKYYQENIWYFFLLLFVHLIESFLKALLTVYIKGLMGYKYFSQYKVCYLYGLINIIITTIVYAIFSTFRCDEKRSMCILEIFSIPGLLSFIISLLQAISLVLTYTIINKFTVCHSFIIFQLEHLTEDKNNDLIIWDVVAVVLLLSDIFFILVFLEFIEINICNISYNTKLNIEKRASQEIEFSIEYCDDNTEKELIEEENSSQANEML